MSGQTTIGNRATQFPITKAVGQQFSPQKAGSSSPSPSVPVPPPSALLINNRKVVIDVRTMSGADIVAVLNSIPGVSASIDGSSSLVVSGIVSIDGDSGLRAVLGI